uniref:huntingtin-interacting protein 1-like n=1 Tax=Myxine glutinosa TaxID=7769 RepID=UPI00358DE863
MAQSTRHAGHGTPWRLFPNESQRDMHNQNVSINKAINSQEVPVKEKHARVCILGTYQEKGAQTFWAVASRLPLTSNAVLNWKFCHVFHKLLRDGHPYVLQDSVRYKKELNDVGRMWGHLNEGYGKMVSTYLRLLVFKMDFHCKNPAFPCNLMLSDEQLERAGENDVNNFFQLTVEMFDYMECELSLFSAVFGSMDMSRPVSMTTPGQCRLAPLIPAVLDSSPLYDFIVKLLFKLHSCLPADTLQGHRDRFREQFKRLREYFHRSSNLQYFKRLIQIPQLPEHPPNFLHASALSEHVSPIVVIPEESSSPECEADLIDTDTCMLERSSYGDTFAEAMDNAPFGILNSRGVGMNGMEQNEREKFARELSSLKEELDTCRLEAERGMALLRARLGELEADLAEQVHLRRQAVEEAEFVRAEMEELQRQREDEERTHQSLTEIEKRAQANEQRYNKLKEKYTELVQNHADLLRKNAEVTKQLSTARQGHQEAEQARLELEKNQTKAEEQVTHNAEKTRFELETCQAEIVALRATQRRQNQVEDELRECLQKVERAVESKSEVIFSLETRLQEKEESISGLAESIRSGRMSLLTAACARAESAVHAGLMRWQDPCGLSIKSTPDLLVMHSQGTMDCTDRLSKSQAQYLIEPVVLGDLPGDLVAFGYSLGELLGRAGDLDLRAVTERTEALGAACQACGQKALTYLATFTDKQAPLDTNLASLKDHLSALLHLAKEYSPQGRDVKQDELGDLVEQEMSATTAAVEQAASRIQEMLNAARCTESSMQREVSESMLSSCTHLMQIIRELVLASKELQKEIVDGGRGVASPQEFYARNSHWTEGLISASKAVGLAATLLVDGADAVVKGDGRLEELIVCSHEVTASTAHLVAASKFLIVMVIRHALGAACQACGQKALTYLATFTDKQAPLDTNLASLKDHLSALLHLAKEYSPQGRDVKQDELGDLVEQEMSATTAAVEQAASRIQEMLNAARCTESSMQREVSESMLSSCTHLMQIIRELVLASKELQKEIVDGGRGVASPQEFYARNSHWTEGLISASKAVGLAATLLVDGADAVVKGDGRLEELIVCSHEVTASTAHLVAASKVKAEKGSGKLRRLQQASRAVTDATACVVASAKFAQEQTEEKATLDFSRLTLTQVKRQEMDTQVRVLELESSLQREREHLGELRKKHYELAGAAEGWDEDDVH